MAEMGYFRINLGVHVSDDYKGLVLRGRKARVVDFEGSNLVHFQVPSGIYAIQASIKRRLELLDLFDPDLDVKSTAATCSDVFDVFLQIRDLKLPLKTNDELAERWAFSLQRQWAELEAAFAASDLGLDRLGLYKSLGPRRVAASGRSSVLGVSLGA